MADEPKNIRLSKAAKELNVSIQTLVEFLDTKGHKVDLNPNVKLTPEQYELVAAKFQTEREVREQAEMIEMPVNGETVSIEADEPIKSQTSESAADEVIIKNVFVEKPSVSRQAADVVKPTPVVMPEKLPVVEKEAKSHEVQPVEPEPPIVEESKVQPVEESAENKADNDGESKIGLKILDKIDLSSIPSSSAPKKGKKSKPSKES